MSQTSLTGTGVFDDDANAAEDARRRALECDKTPRPVVRSCIRAEGCEWLVVTKVLSGDAYARLSFVAAGVVQHTFVVSADRPLRVLDFCAGSGVWGAELILWLLEQGVPREWIHLTAVEIHEPEREHLETIADRVIIGDVMDEALDCPECFGNGLIRGSLGGAAECSRCSGDGLLRFDIVEGNPPFSIISNKESIKTWERSALVMLRRIAKVVALFLPVNALHRGTVGVALREHHPPMLKLDVPLSIGFREHGSCNPKTGKPYSSDTACYNLLVWGEDYDPGNLPRHARTYCQALRALPLEARRWTIEPGRETAAELAKMFGGST